MTTLPRAQPAVVGMGTYRGEATSIANSNMLAALGAGIAGGVRWIDSAINYRAQRSEMMIGSALAVAGSQGIPRSAFTVSTKAGFLPDSPTGSDYHELLRTMTSTWDVSEGRDVTSSGHCLSPKYLRWSIEQSLANLTCSAIDILYLHNPEAQCEIADKEALYARIAVAFAELESHVAAGRIGAYGIATWNALRVPPSHPEHLELSRLIALAREVGGNEHHFRYVQAPVNFLEPELITVAAHMHEDRLRSALAVANAYGLHVVASSPLAAGRLRGRFIQAVDFVRTIPGIRAVLVGVTQEAHGRDAASRNDAPALSPRAWRAMLEAIATEETP